MTTDTKCPSTHPDLVFKRTFLGSNIGCDCFGITDKYGRVYDGRNSLVTVFANGRPCGNNET